MFLLDWLFGKHQAGGGGRAPSSATVPAPEPAHSMEDSESFAPGTTIRYSAGLVERLVRDHHLMLERFGAIREAAHAGRFDEVALLERFRRRPPRPSAGRERAPVRVSRAHPRRRSGATR